MKNTSRDLILPVAASARSNSYSIISSSTLLFQKIRFSSPESPLCIPTTNMPVQTSLHVDSHPQTSQVMLQAFSCPQTSPPCFHVLIHFFSVSTQPNSPNFLKRSPDIGFDIRTQLGTKQPLEITRFSHASPRSFHHNRTPQLQR